MERRPPPDGGGRRLPEGGGPSNMSDTLHEACRVLRSLITHLEGDHSAPSTSTSALVNQQTHLTTRQAPSASTTSHSAQQILSEHRRLFQSQSLGRVNRPPSSRRLHTRSRVQPYQRHIHEPTHTHTFICLALKDTIDVPKSATKQMLYCNGLGERRVKFLQSDGAPIVHEKVLKEFPKLRGVGEYSFLQSGPGNKLVPILEPPEGYSAKYLMSLGSSKVYVRPVNQNIPTLRYQWTKY